MIFAFLNVLPIHIDSGTELLMNARAALLDVMHAITKNNVLNVYQDTTSMKILIPAHVVILLL